MVQPGNLDALVALMAHEADGSAIPWRLADLQCAIALLQESGYPVQYSFRVIHGPRSEALEHHLDYLERRGLVEQTRHPSDPQQDSIRILRNPPFKLNQNFLAKLQLLRSADKQLLQYASSYVIHRRVDPDASHVVVQMKQAGSYSQPLDMAARRLLRSLGIAQRKYSFPGIQDNAIIATSPDSIPVV